MEIIKTARFVSSCPELKSCPEPLQPEFAFIGRSNVGKSSLINMLTGFKGLAKTSQTPGKTKHIAHFMINESWFLVDLPGYGYAKVSKEKRSEFRKAILNYIAKRNTLFCLYVLIDSRIPPQAIDIKFIEWLGEHEIPFVIAFTKTDQVSKTRVGINSDAFLAKLGETWDELPTVFYTSAETKAGREELLTHIHLALKNRE